MAFLKNALTLTLSADNSIFEGATPAIIKITVKNNAKVPVDLPTWPYEVRVSQASGAPVEDSPHGAERKKMFSGDRSFNPTLLLDPGKSITDEENLSDLFALTRPGQYLVTVTQGLYGNDGRYEALRSNVLHIALK